MKGCKTPLRVPHDAQCASWRRKSEASRSRTASTRLPRAARAAQGAAPRTRQQPRPANAPRSAAVRTATHRATAASYGNNRRQSVLHRRSDEVRKGRSTQAGSTGSTCGQSYTPWRRRTRRQQPSTGWQRALRGSTSRQRLAVRQLLSGSTRRQRTPTGRCTCSNPCRQSALRSSTCRRQSPLASA